MESLFNHLLEARKLGVSFRRQEVLRDVNMTVAERDIYFLIGPNGSGKSSLFKALLGIHPPAVGDVRFFGREWKGADRKKLMYRIGALIEDPSFYQLMTVEDNLRIFARYYGLSSEHIEQALAQVELLDRKGEKVSRLSTGMKQRLGIALSLLHRPDVIFLDEPNRGLDPDHIINLRKLITHLNSSEHCTFVISSHILAEAEKVATRVGFLKDGRLIFESDTDRIRDFRKACIDLRELVKGGSRDRLLQFLKVGELEYYEEEGQLWVLFDRNIDIQMSGLQEQLAQMSVGTDLRLSGVSLEDLYRFKI